VSTFRHSRSASVPLLLPGVALLLFSASAAGHGNYPVRGAITASTTGVGDVYDLAISPDGRRVVYIEQDTLGVNELYSVPLDGSAGPVKLSGPTQGDGWFLGFSISPDGLRVVYTADEEEYSVYGLYSAPIAGGAAVQLMPGMDSPYFPSSYRISADGRWVVALAGDEILSAPIDGSSSALAINAGIPPGRFEISPDSRRVVFRGTDGSGDAALYSVAIDAGRNRPHLARRPSRGPVRLTPFPLPGDHVWSLEISANSRRVVYQVFGGLQEIYSVPIDGSAKPVRLNSSLAGRVATGRFDVSPDGTRVVYVADQDQFGRYELYSVPIDASASPVKLNGPLVAGGDVLFYNPGFEISADGTRAVYRADQEIDGIDELYGVPIDGSSAPIKLSAPLVAGEQLSEFHICPDGSRVLYRTDANCYRTVALRSAPIDGSSPAVQFNDPHVGSCSEDGVDEAFEYRISPDSGSVVYLTNRGHVLDLFSTPFDGDTSDIELSQPPSDNLVFDIPFAISPDGSQVAFVARPDGTSGFRLYRVPTDGSSHPLQLSQ